MSDEEFLSAGRAANRKPRPSAGAAFASGGSGIAAGHRPSPRSICQNYLQLINTAATDITEFQCQGILPNWACGASPRISRRSHNPRLCRACGKCMGFYRSRRHSRFRCAAGTPERSAPWSNADRWRAEPRKLAELPDGKERRKGIRARSGDQSAAHEASAQPASMCHPAGVATQQGFRRRRP
jgi:hypothetical protein